MENIEGVATTINFSGDLCINPYWKQWNSDNVFICIKYTKAGLVYLTDPDGKKVTVPKRNCNALIKEVSNWTQLLNM